MGKGSRAFSTSSRIDNCLDLWYLLTAKLIFRGELIEENILFSDCPGISKKGRLELEFAEFFGCKGFSEVLSLGIFDLDSPMPLEYFYRAVGVKIIMMGNQRVIY